MSSTINPSHYDLATLFSEMNTFAPSSNDVALPLVSAIIPVRNCKEYINEAISSVLAQDYHNQEIIIIDDGSSDYDYRELEKIDPRIIVYRLPGLGVSCARNHGMQMSTGRYIAFLDADDIWFPGKLKAQIRYLETHSHVGCVFGRLRRWYSNSDGSFPSAEGYYQPCADVTESEPERSGWMYTRLLAGLLVGMNTAVIRREVFETLGGFDESLRIGEDYLFWLKISRTYEMHALNATVALYRIHSSSAMHQLDPENHQAKLLETSVLRWGLQNPDGTFLTRQSFEAHLAKCHFEHGYRHFWQGSASVARNSFFKALRGGVRPTLSVCYIALSPFRKWVYRFRRH